MSSSPPIKSVPSFLNNDHIDELTPLQKAKALNISLLDQWTNLASAKNLFANLASALKTLLTGLSRTSLIQRLSKQTKIAHPRVASYAFGFDIDGVIVKGPETIQQAKEALKMLNGENPYSIKVPYIFVTNGGGRSEKARSEELSKRLGVHIEEDQVVQGHTPMKDLVDRFKTVLVVGGVGDACRKVAEGYGFKDVVTPLDIMKWKPSVTPYHTLTEEELKVARTRDFSQVQIEAILVFADLRNWAADEQIILELLLSKNGVMGTVSKNFNEGPGIYFAHSDFLWLTNYGLLRYGMGALQVSIAAIYAEHTGRELTVTRFGKPQRGTFRYAEKVLNDWRGKKLREWGRSLSRGGSIGAPKMSDLVKDMRETKLKEEDDSVGQLKTHGGRPSLKSRLSTLKFQMAVDLDLELEDEAPEPQVETEDVPIVLKRNRISHPALGELDIPPPLTVYFVGDTPESDIRFANAHDTTWYSILVKTGVYQEGTEPKYKPKYLCNDVLEAVKYAIEREHQLEVEEWNKNVEELGKLVGGEGLEEDFPEVKMKEGVNVDGDLESGRTTISRN